jgi:hypothetical protein
MNVYIQTHTFTTHTFKHTHTHTHTHTHKRTHTHMDFYSGSGGALLMVRYLFFIITSCSLYSIIILYSDSGWSPKKTHTVIPIVVAGALPLVRYLAGSSLPLVSSWNRTPEVCSVVNFFSLLFLLKEKKKSSSCFVVFSLVSPWNDLTYFDHIDIFWSYWNTKEVNRFHFSFIREQRKNGAKRIDR